MTSRGKAIALLSSGLDSTVSLAAAMADANTEVTLALTINYGQRAAQREIEAAQKIAEYYDTPHKVIQLPWLGELLPKALTPKSKIKNNAEVHGMEMGAEAEMDTTDVMSVNHVWVPNRNGVLLNVAAAYAEATGAESLIFGANAEEAVDFPDNTQQYRDRVNAAFEFSTLNKVKVKTPVGNLRKADIVQLASQLNCPLHLVWSCYEDTPVQCGVCASCSRLKAALKASPGFAVPFGDSQA